MTTHGVPSAGLTCMCTWEPIDDSTYVEYQVAPQGTWHACQFGAPAVRALRASQFKDYLENVQKSDCVKEFTRLMRDGPPIWISDKHALPLPRGATHVCALWFMEGDVTETAKLDGALEGAARQKLWDDMKSFMATDEVRDTQKKKEKRTEEAGSGSC